jgi:hypothetical protein
MFQRQLNAVNFSVSSDLSYVLLVSDVRKVSNPRHFSTNKQGKTNDACAFSRCTDTRQRRSTAYMKLQQSEYILTCVTLYNWRCREREFALFPRLLWSSLSASALCYLPLSQSECVLTSASMPIVRALWSSEIDFSRTHTRCVVHWTLEWDSVSRD